MEPVRPQVDAFLLDWITREPVKRSWFFEQRDGNCRLMSTLAIELSRTARTWGRAVAPLAEWVVRVLWSRAKKPAARAATADSANSTAQARGKGGNIFLRVRVPVSRISVAVVASQFGRSISLQHV